MKVIMISGDGQGAGKTFLALKMTDNKSQIFSIANLIRAELQKKFPEYDWYNREPEYKMKTMVRQTRKSVLQHLDEHGRGTKEKDPFVWARHMVDVLTYARDNEKHDTVVIDDLRFVDEYEYIKKALQSEHIVHFHVCHEKAKPEPHYENERLKQIADYLVYRQKKSA